jgi:transposase
MKRPADDALTADGTLTSIDIARLTTARHRFRPAVLIGRKQAAARAGPLTAGHHGLARRPRERQDDYLRFTQDPRVPFGNNAAEREIRMSGLRIEVSGCTRPMTGAEALCAIRSYTSTAAARYRTGLPDALTTGTSGATWIPGTS